MGWIVEPVESAERWHRWSVKGTGEALTRVVERLDATLPSGGKRLQGAELQRYQPLVRPESAWYCFPAKLPDVVVTVSVERRNDSELRGGPVFWMTGPIHPTPPEVIPAAWDRVMRFLDESIVPAAQSVGASISAPSAEELFLADLPTDVSQRLQDFSRTARKSLPLNREEAERWRAFVVGAFRAKAVVDPQRFVNWLVHEGWRQEDATELSQRFSDQSQLLMRYAEEVSAA